MAAIGRSARDIRLLDALEALPPEAFAGRVWRVVREGRDPLQCSAVGGRWDDQTFEVLYTSTRADGALAELDFHLSRGQPVIPSAVSYRLHELRIGLSACIRLGSLDELGRLGVRTDNFGQVSYAERHQEYPRTQEVAEAAYFLGRDGIIVPSARAEWPNVVIFCEAAGPAAMEAVKDHGEIDWSAWKRSPFGY